MQERGIFTAAALFAVVWDTLCGVVGSAATATIIRRCQPKTLGGALAAEAVDVSRVGLDYSYRVPESWNVPGAAGTGAFQEFVTALVPLLRELTGMIVIRRLQAVPQLHDIVFDGE